MGSNGYKPYKQGVQFGVRSKRVCLVQVGGNTEEAEAKGRGKTGGRTGQRIKAKEKAPAVGAALPGRMGKNQYTCLSSKKPKPTRTYPTVLAGNVALEVAAEMVNGSDCARMELRFCAS